MYSKTNQFDVGLSLSPWNPPRRTATQKCLAQQVAWHRPLTAHLKRMDALLKFQPVLPWFGDLSTCSRLLQVLLASLASTNACTFRPAISMPAHPQRPGTASAFQHLFLELADLTLCNTLSVCHVRPAWAYLNLLKAGNSLVACRLASETGQSSIGSTVMLRPKELLPGCGEARPQLFIYEIR